MRSRGKWLATTMVLVAGVALAIPPQARSSVADPQKQDQTIPDAPTPQAPPPSSSQGTNGALPAAPPPHNSPGSNPAPAEAPANPQPAPSPEVKTIPPGTAPQPSASDQLYRFRKNVSLVVIPVTVRDQDNHLVEGLLKNDFSVYEDGARQEVSFFTSDPMALSAAIVLDQNLPATVMSKVNQTLAALPGAFSAYDEVALYTYGNTVRRVADFSGVGEDFSQELRAAKRPGVQGGVPVVGGPMTSGPTVNGRPVDPGIPTPVYRTVPREYHVLNDAILRAGLDLSQLPRERRKIIFVITDGREEGSHADASEVLKVLLSNEITVYAVAVGSSAIPGLSTLEKFHLPGMAYGDILPRYVEQTGGTVFPEFNERAIEGAYAKLTEVARNQYTIGYTTRATAAGQFRSIEVRVHRLNLRVFAKQGYYPLPPPPSR